jgi:hypothetical protein
LTDGKRLINENPESLNDPLSYLCSQELCSEIAILKCGKKIGKFTGCGKQICLMHGNITLKKTVNNRVNAYAYFGH